MNGLVGSEKVEMKDAPVSTPEPLKETPVLPIKTDEPQKQENIIIKDTPQETSDEKDNLIKNDFKDDSRPKPKSTTQVHKISETGNSISVLLKTALFIVLNVVAIALISNYRRKHA